MKAKGLFLLGALSFWLPEIVLYAWTRRELNGKLITFLLPGIFLIVYLVVAILRPRRTAKLSAAIFMVLGVIFLGTLAMTIGANIRGAGFLEHPGSTLLGVLLGTIIPIYAFIVATYDGSLYADRGVTRWFRCSLSVAGPFSLSQFLGLKNFPSSSSSGQNIGTDPKHMNSTS